MKKLLAIALCAAMVVSMSACSMSASTTTSTETKAAAEAAPAEDAGGDKKIKVGASYFDLSDPYFVEIANGAKAYAEANGIELVTDDPASDAQKQVSSIENFIVSGCDAIIVAAVEPESINNILKQAQDKGIKIVAQNHPVENYDSFITIIEYNYGYECGKMCGEWINEKYPDEEIEVGVIGAGLHTTGVERTEGMVDGLTETCDHAKVVSEQDGEGLTEKAMTVTENMLEANPNIKAIMCFDDLAGLGALEAVKANKSEAEQKDFGVFGLDAVEQAIEEIKKGGAYKGTVDIAPYATGEKGMQVAVDLVNGKAVEKQYLQDMVPVTSKNIDQY